MLNISLVLEQSLTRYRNVRHLTEHDNDDGYFAQAMVLTYREAAQIRGKRSDFVIHMLTKLTRTRHWLQEHCNDNAGRLRQQENPRFSVCQNG